VNLDQLPDPEPPSRPSANGEAAGTDHLAQIRIHLDVDGVPGALKSIAQWVGWRIKAPDKPGGKVGKVPVNPYTGRDASTTNPASWGTFEQALASAERHGLAGVGFVFTEASGIVGVDLDKCRDPDTGAVEPWAEEIVSTLDSYAEISPTGTGVHVLARGALPPKGRRRDKVEMYVSKRFFTVTGVRIAGAPSTVEDRVAQLRAVHAQWIRGPEKAGQDLLARSTPLAASTEASEVTGEPEASADSGSPDPTHVAAGDGDTLASGWTVIRPRLEMTDDELLAAARKAKNGSKFTALFDQGDVSSHKSPSESDFALCAMLAFWTGPDAARIDRLFRASKLFRPKWDEPRGESSYGADTITNVLSKADTFWTPRPRPQPRRWTRQLEDVQVTCEQQGRRTLGIRCTWGDGDQFVDRFQFETETGRHRVASRLALEAPQLDADQIADALEELASDVWTMRSEDADGADGADGLSPTSSDSSDADIFASLVTDAEDVELFHTPGKHDALAYATIAFADHRETWPVRSQAFKLWAVRRFREDQRRVPGGNAITDGLNAIVASAIFDGEEHPVFVRVAGHENTVLIDLGDDLWRAVQVSATGWTVVDSHSVPVRFIRRRGMQALPIPVYGYGVEELRPYVNLPADSSWKLFVLVVTTYLLPSGPYVVLVVNGEQGSAKSTLMRVARDLVDPNKAGLRRPPKDERDLMIAATNAWIVAYDNISGLPAFLSDAICVLATGGGFGARELYTDDEEKLFDAMRPVMLNGIEDIATRADLLDRAIILTLPAIPDDVRMQNADQRSGFERVRAGVFGALLTGVASVLKRRADVRLTRSPRMADFATSAVAAAPAYGWSEEEVLDLIESSRNAANEIAIGNSLVAEGILRLLGSTNEWCGTCGDLLMLLSGESDATRRVRAGWPKTPRGMRGALTRAAANLRRAGVEVDYDRTGHEGSREVLIRRVRGQPSAPSASSASGSGGPEKADQCRRSADGRGAEEQRPSASNRQQMPPHQPGGEGSGSAADGADDADGCFGTSETRAPDDVSRDEWEVV
jgi:primase-polymerase (primpol)-like protein